VLYAAARNPDSLVEVVTLDPERVVAVALDTTDHAAVDAAAELADDTTLLINNAGVAAFAPASRRLPTHCPRDGDQLRRHLQDGPRLRPDDRAQRRGAIVNLLSMAGLAAIPPLAGYSASKAAAHSMTQTVRAEHDPAGSASTAVYPAGIGTEMLAHPSIPHSSPEEVAAASLRGSRRATRTSFPAPSRAPSEVWWADPKGLSAATPATEGPATQLGCADCLRPRPRPRRRHRIGFQLDPCSSPTSRTARHPTTASTYRRGVDLSGRLAAEATSAPATTRRDCRARQRVDAIATSARRTERQRRRFIASARGLATLGRVLDG